MMATQEGLPVSSNAIDHLTDLAGRAFACSGSAILIADARQSDCPIVFANPAFCRMTGYSQEEVVGRNCRFLQNDDRDQPGLEAVRAGLAARREVNAVLRNYRKDGSLFWNQLCISPVVDATGTVTHFVGVQTDITAQKHYEEQLAYQATHDLLTGLPKRAMLDAHLGEIIGRTAVDREVTALLILDIDRFHLFNDAHGYAMADQLLKLVADRLQAVLRNQAFLSRHGIDEFAVAVERLPDAAAAELLSQKLLHALSAPFMLRGESLRPTCSVGIALYPQDGSDVASIVRYAGLAVQRAKELGGNNVQLFAQELSERASQRRMLEASLRRAVESGGEQLALCYQPLVDLQSGKVNSFEALARWEHPELGEVPPTRFIAVAEECGLIDELGDWALRRVCSDMRAWREQGLPEVPVTLNVSPRQFRDAALPGKIASVLESAGIAPRLLCLELTENALMQDTAASKATLERLQALGIELVLDDFGTGYSSLAYLKRFSFSKVKIDCAFVDNVAIDPDNAAISKAIISMAHGLGIRVVAEGVETEAQCDFLRRNMCDEIQGFLVAPAIPSEQVGTFLAAGTYLPSRLLRMHKPPRTLLIVDDEVNIVSALKRLLRRDNYTILSANSGIEGLAVLEKNAVDVIVSDQRMPGMTGVEFLGKAKELYPETVRIVLSGYSELQSVTDAVNQGAIYKFLMKPWDDDQLRGHVEEAFRRKELADENRRLSLEVQTANFELAAANRRLGEVLDQLQQQLSRNEISLNVVHEVLQHVPVPVIGLDESDFIAFANSEAQRLFNDSGLLLGSEAATTVPDLLEAIAGLESNTARSLPLRGDRYRIICHRMGHVSESNGKLVTLTKLPE